MDKMAQALQLLKAGARPADIADRLAYESVQDLLDDVAGMLREDVSLADDAARALEDQRLDMAQMALTAQVRAGDTRAIGVLLQIMDRRAKWRTEAPSTDQGPIRRETEKSLAAAIKAEAITDMDAGAVGALRSLADAFDYLISHGGKSPSGSFDNVTGPTYLRYCSDLGLTPASRKATRGSKPPRRSGRLAALRDDVRGSGAA